MSIMVKVAAAQINPKLMKKEINLEKIALFTREAAGNDVKLIVFPECALTGYRFRSKEEAIQYAESIPGPATDVIAELCKKLDSYVILGLLELDKDKLYNSAAFVGPEGLVGKYRKTHIPKSAVDRFVEPGEKKPQVFNTPIGNIGILICHDITFPESARILMLQGADIIAIPTNWPRQPDITSRHIVNTRAVENFVHIIAADRVGIERKGRFLGMSKIINARGITRASAGVRHEEILYAELDLSYARQKYVEMVPGVRTIDIINDRRPEFYDDIARPDAYQPAM